MKILNSIKNEIVIPKNTSCILITNIKHILGLGFSNNQSNFSDNLLEITFLRSPLEYTRMILFKILKINYISVKPACASSEFYIINDDKNALDLNIDGESVTILEKNIKISSLKSIKFLNYIK